jgi:hypothetical protein
MPTSAPSAPNGANRRRRPGRAETLAAAHLLNSAVLEKLHGARVLMRMHRQPEDRANNWLLIKERADAAVTGSKSCIAGDTGTMT